jgi:hypothetical protein
MFRFLLRALGLLLLAAGFVGLVIDGARSIANDRLAYADVAGLLARPLGERWAGLPQAVREVHPLLWDPLLVNFLAAPAGLLAFALGAVLIWLGRRPPEPIGYPAGR